VGIPGASARGGGPSGAKDDAGARYHLVLSSGTQSELLRLRTWRTQAQHAKFSACWASATRSSEVDNQGLRAIDIAGRVDSNRTVRRWDVRDGEGRRATDARLKPESGGEVLRAGLAAAAHAGWSPERWPPPGQVLTSATAAP